MSAFGYIFLQTGIRKEYAAIRDKLNISNLTAVSDSIESCHADAKNPGSFLTTDKPFQCKTSNLSMLLVMQNYDENISKRAYRLQPALSHHSPTCTAVPRTSEYRRNSPSVIAGL